MSIVQEFYQLEVLAGQRIIVPGCEPTSYVSSKTLSYAFKNQLKCGTGYVPLKKALSSIQGSFVKYGVDWNRGNTRTMFFVFPAVIHTCDCNINVDWYAVLRSLATEDTTETTSYDYCSMNDSGYCPSPDFDSIPAPEQSPYLSPDTAGQLVGKVLPPIPPWQID